MKYKFSPAKNPRVLIVQKVYAQLVNNDQKIIFEKHRFKKFIKDVVFGTTERLELINDEIKHIEENFNIKKYLVQVAIQLDTYFLFEVQTKPCTLLRHYDQYPNHSRIPTE